MTDRRLRKVVTAIVRKHERGENHDAGAFDPDCGLCLILADLRAALGEGAGDAKEILPTSDAESPALCGGSR
jgi:hypothetical protein